MKLITAIINKEDTRAASAALVKAGFSVTRLSTTGGFLMAGNTTLLIGVEDERVDDCIRVLRNRCKQRTGVVPSVTGYDDVGARVVPMTVTVGGATVFVTDVERYEKL
jgi:uncharacterized protein YaaQ